LIWKSFLLFLLWLALLFSSLILILGVVFFSSLCVRVKAKKDKRKKKEENFFLSLFFFLFFLFVLKKRKTREKKREKTFLFPFFFFMFPFFRDPNFFSKRPFISYFVKGIFRGEREK